MKIVVCVKQVPEIADVQVDPNTGTLIREGVASILNPFCEYAVDQALALRAVLPEAEIVALSMGPPQARAALMRCLEMGVDRGVLLADRKFAGSDTWATSRTLAEAIRIRIPDYSLVLVGKQAIDGDTAQVGPEIAEALKIPQITYGVHLEWVGDGKRIRVRRETEEGYEIVESRLPVLVSVSRGEPVRRVCSLQEILDAREKELTVETASSLGLDENELGLNGSLTQVVRVFAPSIERSRETIDGTVPERAAQRFVEFLQERKLL